MAQECFREGKSKEEVLEEIDDYLEKVLQVLCCLYYCSIGLFYFLAGRIQEFSSFLK